MHKVPTWACPEYYISRDARERSKVIFKGQHDPREEAEKDERCPIRVMPFSANKLTLREQLERGKLPAKMPPMAQVLTLSDEEILRLLEHYNTPA